MDLNAPPHKVKVEIYMALPLSTAKSTSEVCSLLWAHAHLLLRHSKFPQKLFGIFEGKSAQIRVCARHCLLHWLRFFIVLFRGRFGLLMS